MRISKGTHMLSWGILIFSVGYLIMSIPHWELVVAGAVNSYAWGLIVYYERHIMRNG